MYEAGLQPTWFSYAKSLVQPLGFVSNISKFKMKNILQLSSLFVLLSTSVIAEVLPTADEVKAVLIKVEYGKDFQFRATAEDWKEIRSHMMPARMPPKHTLFLASWKGQADATIIKKDVKSLKVRMWMPASGPAHFGVGVKPYRGGNSSKTLKAILDAHQRSMKRALEQKN